MHVTTIAIGSVPQSLVERSRSGALVVSETPTRLQVTSRANRLNMFSEFAALADGVQVPSGCVDSMVVKAQLPGPITLIQTEAETLQTSIRRIRAALDTLFEMHPDLNELWFDEPMLVSAPDDWLHLLRRIIAAIRSEYLDLRIGVHCCAELREHDLRAVEADAWAFDLSHRHALDAMVRRWKEKEIPAELVWGVIPTDGSAPAPGITSVIIDAHRALQSTRPIRITTGCGLGMRSEDTVAAVLAHQTTLLAEIRQALG